MAPSSEDHPAPGIPHHWAWGLTPGRLAVSVILGAALGFSASASNAWPSPLTYVFNAGWAWAGMMVLGGFLARRALGGMVTGLIAVTVACTTYFLGDSWWAGAGQNVVERTTFGAFLPELAHWVLVAALLSPGLGAVGAWQRRRDLLGLLSTLVVPAAASVEMLLPRRWGEAGIPGETAVRWLVWIVSATIAVWALRRYLRGQKRAVTDTDRSTPRPARGQLVLVTVLASFSLAVGVAYTVEATGLLHPAQRGAGLTPEQSRAQLIARVQIVDNGTDGGPVTATMTRAQVFDTDARPQFEFEIESLQEAGLRSGSEYVVFLTAVDPPHSYRAVEAPNAVIPLDRDGRASIALPDWLDETLDVQSP